MTVEIRVMCDGLNCSASREILQDNDRAIEHIGWFKDFRTGYHFCSACRAEAEKEIEEDL